MEAVVEAEGSDSPRWFLVGVFVTHCNSITGRWRLEAGGRGLQGLAALAEVARPSGRSGSEPHPP